MLNDTGQLKSNFLIRSSISVGKRERAHRRAPSHKKRGSAGENLVLKNLRICKVAYLAAQERKGGRNGGKSGGVCGGVLCSIPSQSLSLTEVVKCESNCVLFLGLTCGTPWTPSPSQ